MVGRTREVALAVLGLGAFGAFVTVFGALRDEVAPVTPVAGPAATAPATAGADSNAAPRSTVPGPSTAALVPPASLAPEAAPPAPKPAAEAPRPSFDVVRVEPTGESVIAGRAQPGAIIELLRNGEVHDRAVADGAGLFAFVPPPFPPGPSEVSLRATPAGGEAAVSLQSVTVVVAPRRDESPVVALATPGQPTAVLSTPAAPAAPTAPPSAGKETRPLVKVETVEAEEGGQLYVSGRAAPGATVRLYLNETLVASGAATPDGRISFSIRRGVAAGDYRVRLDEAGGETGSVVSRAEVTFAMPQAGAVAQPAPGTDPANRAAATGTPGSPSRTAEASAKPMGPAGVNPGGEPGRTVTASADPSGGPRMGEPGLVVVPQISTAAVTRGDSLWRISRRIYGSGLRYTVIYDANLRQIRDPDRIYPGQVFVVPGEAAR
ncbi:LysM peptidoglycan-binding domain-containing protein [Salinarimonas soli]|uniref:LysM peptidoglycan-binding domain-containing protein n=1 Tax=Salinarimonas soli TaxID=1638099 RepID=A0A5B2VD85_9HYPH|nr:LysM peptidoglycan-binding domain-containing protein [Salinarimonas soli]KAA2237463.1 LysM peptidoglycan-binding domain-containing protein [Salinarimonas soli]